MADDDADEKARHAARQHWLSVLGQLTPRERQILRDCFGIDPESPTPDYSLEEVARQFDITRKRIREIERRALGKRGNDDGQEGV